MTILQWMLILVSLAAIWFIWRRVRQAAIRRVEGFLWTAIWLTIVIVVLQPSFSTRVANIFGVGRGADFVLIIAVVVLFLLVFQLHLALHRLERILTEFIRRQALRELEDELDQSN